MPGWILIETDRVDAIYELCAGISSVTLDAVYPITREQAPTYLKEPPSFEPRKGGWLRLKTRPYRHDLAYITEFDRANRATVLVVPRLDFVPPPNPQKRGRRTRAWRPKKGLFDYRFAAKQLGSEAVSIRNNLVVFRDQCFVEGFLSLEDVAFFDAEPYPTRDELLWFEACSQVDKQSFQRALLKISLAEIQNGDRVRIMDGQSKGLIGSIASVQNNDVDVLYPDGVLESVPLLSVRKRIAVGDEAIVVAGRSKGVSGWVVGTLDEDVYLYSPLHDHEVSASSASTKLSSNS